MIRKKISVIILIIFLTSFASAEYKECFQESATMPSTSDTNNCGLIYEGSYSGRTYEDMWVDGGLNGGSGDRINHTGWNDSDYLTFSVLVNMTPVYANYIIPNNTRSAKFGIVVPYFSGNYSVFDSCLNNILQIKIQNDYAWTYINETNEVISYSRGLMHASCFDYSSSSWKEFWTQPQPNVWLFEDFVLWNISYDPVHPIKNQQPIHLNQNQNQVQQEQNIQSGSAWSCKVLNIIPLFMIIALLILTSFMILFSVNNYENITPKIVIVMAVIILVGAVFIKVISMQVNSLCGG